MRAHLTVRWSELAPAREEAFLDDGERARARGFRDPVLAERFVARRGFVRAVVAEHLGCVPSVVRIRQRCGRCGGPHGQPEVIAPAGRRAHVSWSSVDGLAVVAVSSRPVGVDVERASSPPGWVEVEAVLKAVGHGLHVDPALVLVRDGRIVRWAGPGRRPRVRVVDLQAPTGHVAALALGGRGPVRARAASL